MGTAIGATTQRVQPVEPPQGVQPGQPPQRVQPVQVYPCSLRNRNSQCRFNLVASATGTVIAVVASAKGTASAGVAKVTTFAATTIHPVGAAHRLNMELDLRSLFGPMCTAVLIG